jgi:trans-aconitate methyltransferase
MKRITEPELMNDPDQVLAYAQADFSEPHNMFIEALCDRLPAANKARSVLDLGCGPADISIRFARRFPDAIVHAVDGAATMLAEAARAIAGAGLEDRIMTFEQNLPQLQLPNAHYDLIICNSLLHHLHSPATLWECLISLCRQGTGIFIMDLMRPRSTKEARKYVKAYAADSPDILQRDFYHSLLAAFTPAEVNDQLHEAGLGYLTVEILSDRHLCVFGEIDLH